MVNPIHHHEHRFYPLHTEAREHFRYLTGPQVIESKSSSQSKLKSKPDPDPDSRSAGPLTDQLSKVGADHSAGHLLLASLQMPRQDPVEFRIQVILAALSDMHIDPMCIPRGQKKHVMVECLKYRKVFTASTFDAAWKQASKDRRLCAENRERYAIRHVRGCIDSVSMARALSPRPLIPVGAANSDNTTQFISSTPSNPALNHATACANTAQKPVFAPDVSQPNAEGHQPMILKIAPRAPKSQTFEITPQGFKLVPPRPKSQLKCKPLEPSGRVITVEMLFAPAAKSGGPA